jgi:hypothetical protein
MNKINNLLKNCAELLKKAIGLLKEARFWPVVRGREKRALFDHIRSAKYNIALAIKNLKTRDKKRWFWIYLSSAYGNIEKTHELAKSFIYEVDEEFWKLLIRARKNLIEVRKASKSSRR